MERLYLPPEMLTEAELRLLPEQAHYLTRVLRLAPGAALRVFDGVSAEYEARILSARRGDVVLQIGAKIRQAATAPVSFTLAQGLPKSGKMEVILQKAVELGVFRLIPFLSRYGEARLPRDMDARLERWERIAQEACRQCERITLPRLEPPVDFEHLCERMETLETLMAYERADSSLRDCLRARPSPEVMLVIGPEGGFSEEEAQRAQACGARLVSLGPRVLRTETAGPALLAVLQQAWGDWDLPRDTR